MTKTIIAVVITFVIAVIWQKRADDHNLKLTAILLQGMLNDMDEMAKKIGYKNTYDYFVEAKGEDYARRAELNLNNAFKALK